jgi:hypothetical protein
VSISNLKNSLIDPNNLLSRRAITKVSIPNSKLKITSFNNLEKFIIEYDGRKIISNTNHFMKIEGKPLNCRPLWACLEGDGWFYLLLKFRESFGGLSRIYDFDHWSLNRRDEYYKHIRFDKERRYNILSMSPEKIWVLNDLKSHQRLKINQLI